MKIALLGTSASGKTVYFSAIYYKFRNIVTWPFLTERKRCELLNNGIDKQVGFRLRMDNIGLESRLSGYGDLLMQKPIIDWPPGNTSLDKTNIQVRFDFLPISNSEAAIDGRTVRTYQRDIEVYDPPRSAFRGGHEDSQEILDELGTCDVGIVFLPADRLLDISSDGSSDIDGDEWSRVMTKIALGSIINKVVEKIQSKLNHNDIFPLCFIISKSDLFYREKNSVELMENLVYEQLLVPFSREHPEFVICACPVSVLDPTTGNFKSTNLEWPFLFAAGGTLMRNYSLLAAEAAASEEEAHSAEVKASELLALKRRSLWLRFKRWCRDFETIGQHQRTAAYLRDYAGRKIVRANDDRNLAYDIWSSIAAEGRERGLRVLMNGEYVEDIGVAFEIR